MSSSDNSSSSSESDSENDSNVDRENDSNRDESSVIESDESDGSEDVDDSESESELEVVDIDPEPEYGHLPGDAAPAKLETSELLQLQDDPDVELWLVSAPSAFSMTNSNMANFMFEVDEEESSVRASAKIGSENFEAISVGKEEVSQLIAVAEDKESSSLRLLKPMQRHVQIVRVPEIIERTKTASSGSSPLNRAYTRVNQRENLGFRVRPFGFTESSKRSKRKRPHSSSKKAKKKKSKKQDKRKKKKKEISR
eukprot:g2867.t1